ncbi:MAG: trypsin-like peptidase domain-containing protein, partial [Acidobacteriota bacterium]|nr:trypsin-like peptidase domain-containing protein [Acidobacteriota bacterium]
SLRTASTSEATSLAALPSKTTVEQNLISREPIEPKNLEQPANLLADLPNFSDIAEQTVKAVTNISSRQVVRQRSPFDNDPFFRYFFGDSPGMSGYRERPSLGSGVIVAGNGYILTNAHVVGRNSRGVTVTLADEREYEAVVVGRDESTDIALLKIEASELPTVPWGDSSTLRIAQWVLAVGNPFQLSQTVTLGIVSAVGRDNLGVASYEDFIQTDAAINPGNSGGALINASGELVGINTAIYSDSGGYQGVGFAVPSNLARRVMEELSEYGEVRRGSLGWVDVRPLTPQLAREVDAPDTRGVVVWQIHGQSAAANAGVEPGDVIRSIDGQPIDDVAAFGRLISDAEVDSTVTLGLLRYGRPIELRLIVERERLQQR